MSPKLICCLNKALLCLQNALLRAALRGHIFIVSNAQASGINKNLWFFVSVQSSIHVHSRLENKWRQGKEQRQLLRPWASGELWRRKDTSIRNGGMVPFY